MVLYLRIPVHTPVEQGLGLSISMLFKVHGSRGGAVEKRGQGRLDGKPASNLEQICLELCPL